MLQQDGSKIQWSLFVSKILLTEICYKPKVLLKQSLFNIQNLSENLNKTRLFHTLEIRPGHTSNGEPDFVIFPGMEKLSREPQLAVDSA